MLVLHSCFPEAASFVTQCRFVTELIHGFVEDEEQRPLIAQVTSETPFVVGPRDSAASSFLARSSFRRDLEGKGEFNRDA